VQFLNRQPLKFGFRFGFAQRLDRLGVLGHGSTPESLPGFRANGANEKMLAFPFAAVNRRLRIG
jgi:hypothetical protein